MAVAPPLDGRYTQIGFYPGQGEGFASIPPNAPSPTAMALASSGDTNGEFNMNNATSSGDTSGGGGGAPGVPGTSTATGFDAGLAGAGIGFPGIAAMGLPGMMGTAISGLGQAVSNSGIASNMTSNIEGNTFGQPAVNSQASNIPGIGILGNAAVDAMMGNNPGLTTTAVAPAGINSDLSDVDPNEAVTQTASSVSGSVGDNGQGIGPGATSLTGGAAPGSPGGPSTNAGNPVGNGPGAAGSMGGNAPAGPTGPSEAESDNAGPSGGPGAGPAGGGNTGSGTGTGAGDAAAGGTGDTAGDASMKGGLVGKHGTPKGGFNAIRRPLEQGGFVSQGDPNAPKDDVPAMLHEGEFVIPQPAMKALAQKTGGYQQAAQQIKELVIRFAQQPIDKGMDAMENLYQRQRGQYPRQ